MAEKETAENVESTKFCTTCGAKIRKEAEICPKCGVRQPGQAAAASEDKAGGLINVASCCFPVVGMVLYFIWKDSKPKAANEVCMWAIVGLVISGVIWGLSFIAGIAGSF